MSDDTAVKEECCGTCDKDCCEKKEEELPKREEEREPQAEDFDVLRPARMKSFQRLDNVLQKANSEHRMSRGQALLMVNELRNLTAAHEQVIQMIISDFFEVAKLAGALNRNLANLSLSQSATLKVLRDKNLVTDEEIQKAFAETAVRIRKEMEDEMKAQQEAKKTEAPVEAVVEEKKE